MENIAKEDLRNQSTTKKIEFSQRKLSAVKKNGEKLPLGVNMNAVNFPSPRDNAQQRMMGGGII